MMYCKCINSLQNIHNKKKEVKIFSSFVCSVCISAVILSSETLNEEPARTNTEENVSPKKPIVALESDLISEKLSESRTENDKITKVNLEVLTKTHESEHKPHIEKHVLRSETPLPQANTLDKQQNEVILEEQSSGEPDSGNNMYVFNIKNVENVILVRRSEKS